MKSLLPLLILLTGCTHSFHLPPATGPAPTTHDFRILPPDCSVRNPKTDEGCTPIPPAPKKAPVKMVCWDGFWATTDNEAECKSRTNHYWIEDQTGRSYPAGDGCNTATCTNATCTGSAVTLMACAYHPGIVIAAPAAPQKAADAVPEAPVSNLFCPFKANERGEQIPCRLNSKNQVEYIDGTTPEAGHGQYMYCPKDACRGTEDATCTDEHGKEIPCRGSEKYEGFYTFLHGYHSSCKDGLPKHPVGQYTDPVRTITIRITCINGQRRFIYWVSKTKAVQY